METYLLMSHSIGYTFNHWGDIAAIPFFFMLTLYFYQHENKTPYEWILLLFSASAFVADIIFTYFYFTSK